MLAPAAVQEGQQPDAPGEPQTGKGGTGDASDLGHLPIRPAQSSLPDLTGGAFAGGENSAERIAAEASVSAWIR